MYGVVSILNKGGPFIQDEYINFPINFHIIKG